MTGSYLQWLWNTVHLEFACSFACGRKHGQQNQAECRGWEHHEWWCLQLLPFPCRLPGEQQQPQQQKQTKAVVAGTGLGSATNRHEHSTTDSGIVLNSLLAKDQAGVCSSWEISVVNQSQFSLGGDVIQVISSIGSVCRLHTDGYECWRLFYLWCSDTLQEL